MVSSQRAGFYAVWAAGLCLSAFSGGEAVAQSITMTAPASPNTVNEGDDYATNVLNNAWDFNERRDIGWEENFNGPSVSANGVWQGTNAGTGGYVFPLFGGFPGSLFAEGLPGDRSLPSLGIKHPIDASKYRLLSYRLNQTSRSSFAVYWDNGGASYWPDGSQRGASYDGVYHAAVGVPNSGYKVYSFDLTNLGSSFEQSAGSWSGNVVALRLDPSVAGAAGSTLQLDWVRLVDPDSAPTMTISWNSSGLNSNRLTTLYVDNNNSGFDGTPIRSWGDGTDPGSFALKTAMFPPGDYYFYVRSQSGASLSTVTTSGYSSRLRVLNAPKVTISAPTEVSGGDYASTEVGNAWDMSDSADIANLPGSSWPDQWRQFLSHSFIGGVFQAVADLPWTQIGNAESDAQIHLNVPTSKPIDTSKYRYLTYRMAVDEAGHPTIADKVEHGWVTRPVYWGANFDTGGRPKAHVVYEGWHTYTIDLWDDNIVEAGVPWKSHPFLKHLRLDPLETTIYTWFFFDWVMLTAENRTSSNHYSIAWSIEDSDSSSFSTSIYYDTDNTGFDGTLITTRSGLTTGSQSYDWNTSGLPNGGRYYLYFVTSDGTHSNRVYSTVPVVIGDYVATPRITKVPLDYDGDGISDPAIYRIDGQRTKKVKVCTKKKGKKKKCKYVSQRTGGSGNFYVKRSAQGDYVQGWGGANYQPISGDFDGDSVSDYGTVVSNGGKYIWNIFLSGDKVTYSVNKFGSAGDTIVVADYNGDGSDDIAVFRDGIWSIHYRNGYEAAVAWGTAGDRPVTGDYDGDGFSDFAIWRPSDGSWWIIYSSTGVGMQFSWGIPGDKPVQGDWNADGRTDLAVWRPSNGSWYIRDIASAQVSTYQFGINGDKPLVGDFDGDGQLDLTVWRPSQGIFYHNNRAGSIRAVQHGKSSDRLPLNESQDY